jgi:hypothetical protein
MEEAVEKIKDKLEVKSTSYKDIIAKLKTQPGPPAPPAPRANPVAMVSRASPALLGPLAPRVLRVSQVPPESRDLRG